MTGIVPEHLRQIRMSIDDLKVEVRNFNLRVGAVEHVDAGLRLADTGQNAEIDRVERRLDLAD